MGNQFFNGLQHAVKKYEQVSSCGGGQKKENSMGME